jgi:siroheme synthase
MGLAHLDFLMNEFLKRGADPDLPAAVIENGTRTNQVTVTGTISDLAAKAVEAGLRGPTIIIIGHVVTLRDKLNWYAPTAAQ